MNKNNNHEPKNLWPECDPSECYGCPYFDTDTHALPEKGTRAASIAQTRSQIGGWIAMVI